MCIRDRIRNGDGSMAAPCTSPAVMTESLTSHPECENHEEIDPQHGHEMPVQRRGPEHVHGPRSIVTPKAAQRVRQGSQSTEQVQRVNGRQYVEERAARARGEKHSLRGELRPGEILPAEK